METKQIEKKARGFSGLIAKIMETLNENLKFKENFKNTQMKFLLDASNLNYAALVTIDNGTVTVEGVSNKPRSNLDKKKLGWDGFVSVDSQIFLALAMDRISMLKVALLWLRRKVKMKGILKLLKLLKIFALLNE